MSFSLRAWEKAIFSFPRYQDLHLDRVRAISKTLGSPETKMPPILHVAGTNGKGSTCAFLKTILVEAGFKVHLYTSPHLVRLNERFMFANTQATDETLNALFQDVWDAKGTKDCTWFEFLTLAAFLGFSRQDADFTILETGLGGQYDATNIVHNPLLTLITSISFDHHERLGQTILEIAEQKAGILKQHSLALIGQNTPSVLDYFNSYLFEHNIEGSLYGKDWQIEPLAEGFRFCSEKMTLDIPQLGLLGQHQFENASLAISAILALRSNGYKISDKQILDGLKTTYWPGRLQKIHTSTHKEIWVDGAHNESGLAALLSYLDRANRPCSIVLSIAASKNLEPLLNVFEGKRYKLFAYDNKDLYFHEPANIIETGKKFDLTISYIKDIDSFLKDQKGMIVFSGSLHFVGAIQKKF